MLSTDEIYQRIENPINDDKTIQNIIEIYAKSKRTCGNFNSAGELLNHRGIYTNFTTPSKIDQTSYNQQDKENFLISLYNTWIFNVKNLTPNTINLIRQKKLYKDIDGLVTECKKIGKLTTIQEVLNFKKLPIIQENNNVEELQGGDFDHINSKFLSCFTESIGEIKHRLYIGAKHEDVYKLINEFQNECIRQKVPFYYKFDMGKQNRHDTVVIYSDETNFAKYFEILSSIKQKFPHIANNCGNPSFFAGKFDNWIGVADEPDRIYKDTSGKLDNPSFSQTRGVICEEVLDSICIDEFSKLTQTGEKLEYNGKTNTIYNWLRLAIYATLLEEMQTIDSNSVHFLGSMAYSKLSDNEQKKANHELFDYVNNFTNKDLMALLDAYKNKSSNRWLQDQNDVIRKPLIDKRVSLKNVYDSFNQTTNCECFVSLRTFDFAMKKLVPIFEKYNSHFVEDVKGKFGEVCRRHNVDADKFAFNSDFKQSIRTSAKTSSSNSAMNKATSNAQSANSSKSNGNVTKKNTDIGRTIPPKMPIANLVTNFPTLQGKINFLKTLQYETKTPNDFAEELKNNQGQTCEECSCAFAIINGRKCNVSDLTYIEIEKTLFQIIKMPDFNTCKDLISEYMSVLNNAGYVPSYATLGRALIKMDELSNSGLSNVPSRKELLRDCLGKGNSMLTSGEQIASYIKASNGDKSEVTSAEKCKVLLQMQVNYNKFGLDPQNNKPKNYTKLIDPTKVTKPTNLELGKKSDSELQSETDLHINYKDYGFKPCEYTITDSNGEKYDIWKLTPSQLLTQLNATFVHGDRSEIQKMRIICQNMQKHFNPTYGEVAQLAMLINDYYKLTQDTNIDIALDALKEMAKDKYNEGFAIAKFNAQKDGRPKPTYKELVSVLNDLERQKQLNQQQCAESGGYSDGM